MATKRKGLPPRLIIEAKKVFADLGWPISEEPALGEDRIFERFCATLALLSKPERDLFLDLTRNFLLYQTINSYRTGILTVFSKLEVEKFTRIHVYPLLRQSDFLKDKSSRMVHYQFRDARFNLPDAVDNKLQFHDLPGEGLPSDINARDDLCVLLLDDFIGTGETAIDAIKYLHEQKHVEKCKMVIMSLVAQQEGVNRIKADGVEVLVHILRSKGISDYHTGAKKTKYLQLMTTIETRIGVVDPYHLGLGASEALVKMVRTPNNTFPVYWLVNPAIPFKGTFPRKKW